MFLELKNAVEFAHHLPRYRTIVEVLWKHGFGETLKLVALQQLLGIEETAPSDIIHGQPVGVRLRLALEELGPTFIKFGQVLSSRRDLLTDEIYCELCKLQDGVPPFDGEVAKAIVEKELGKPIAKLFTSFTLKPQGGASIAQVHRARLRNGKRLAVKVQRPDIEKTIELDLAILQDLASFAEKHVPDLAGINPVGVVKEFSETLRKELDFTHEAHNAIRFAQQFEGNPNMKVPRIYMDMTTPRVLTMEFVSGLSVRDPEALEEAGIDTVALSESMTNLIYQQVFDFGFFHGDPHPGNMYIQPDGVVALIDYGMMGSFTSAFRSSLAELIAGLAQKDHQAVMNAILEISEERYTDKPNKMLNDVQVFSDLHLSQSLKDINLGEVLNKLLDLLRDNKLRMNGSFYLGVKAFTQVEAIGRSLNPDLNFIKLGEPYARGLIEKKFDLKHLTEMAKRFWAGGIDFLEDFPGDFRNFYQRFKAGKVTIPIEHKIDAEGFEPMRKTLDSIANRMATAVLAAAVLICSSILILAAMPPVIWHVSLFGFLGLVWGGIMGVRLAIHIWKHEGL